MKLSIGTLLALITLIGSILIGGANFGEVRATVEEQKSRMSNLENRFTTIEDYMRQNNAMLSKLANDMEWMKRTNKT